MDQELLNEFLTESVENLASIEEQLMALEADPGNEDLVNAIFRVIHTVKGSCGFIGLSRLEKVAHAGETLLGRIRETRWRVDGEMVSLLLECADAIKAIISGIEETGEEPELDHGDLIERLLAAAKQVESGGAEAGNDAGAGGDDAALAWAASMPEAAQALAAQGWRAPEEVIAAGFARLKEEAGLSGADALKVLGLAKATAKAGEQAGGGDAPGGEVEAAAEAAAAEAAPAPEPQAQPQPKADSAPEPAAEPAKESKGAGKAQPSRPAATVRVDVELLDALMNQVGELVLVRNRLMQMVAGAGSMSFMRVGRELDQVTEQLQAQLLMTRMQPIRTIWSSVPRVVRDISRQLGKRIRVVMDGEDTELDRTILAAIKDPLTHIIRNSCDHGIEPPEARRDAGKPEEGLLRLSAAQESGQIVIVIEDDGAGIPAAKVKEKAVAMGVVSERDAAAMSDQAALQLIFHPGLSTAEKVSNISGRGVGMDVVRSEIEKVGGSVEIGSQPGRGTRLTIRIPLTLAIISSMIIGCRGRRFAVPQISIRELLNAPADDPDWHLIGGQPFYRLRGRLLPVLDLGENLDLGARTPPGGSIVVIDAGERSFGLMVDEIVGAEEIVVKPLGAHFRHLAHYGGCSILGDGAVIPILDANGLAQMIHVSEEARAAIRLASEQTVATRNLRHILIFRHDGSRFAAPMDRIERLEQFPLEAIGRAGGQEVYRYQNDSVIPMLRWGDLIGRRTTPPEEVYGLILADGERRICLQVDEIEDIIEDEWTVDATVPDEFFLGSAVIQGQLTEIVDLDDVLRRARKGFRSKDERAPVPLAPLAEAA